MAERTPTPAQIAKCNVICAGAIQGQPDRTGELVHFERHMRGTVLEVALTRKGAATTELWTIEPSGEARQG